MLRLLRVEPLLSQPTPSLWAARIPLPCNPRLISPNQWGIDRATVLVGQVGRVYIVLVLKWYAKKIVGHHVSRHARTAEWLDAVNQAVNRQIRKLSGYKSAC
ncbi:MAG: hypothetical protein D6690_12340 [Nitrospirae bacterium]|nr:MAG: hypothetical protein D6690_12340 [Nitrospirota bacterium]